MAQAFKHPILKILATPLYSICTDCQCVAYFVTTLLSIFQGFAESTEVVMTSPSLADLLSQPGLLVLPVVPTCEVRKHVGIYRVTVIHIFLNHI